MLKELGRIGAAGDGEQVSSPSPEPLTAHAERVSLEATSQLRHSGEATNLYDLRK